MSKVILFNGSSKICDTIINDSEIFLNIGLNNYVILNRKYPLYFTFFKECNVKTNEIGIMPGYLEVFSKYDIETIKKDIIRTIYYNKYISEVSELIFNNNKLHIKPIQFEDTTNIWIFMCIVIISSLIFSVLILIKIFNNEKNISLFNSKK